jgi:hypothetical protein
VPSAVGPSAASSPRNIPPIINTVTTSRSGKGWFIKGWFIAAVTAAGVIGVVLLVVGILHLVQSFNNGMSQAFSGLGQGAAVTASLADGIAKAQHIPDGVLTPALLNAQHPDVSPVVKWFSAGDSVPPISDGQTDVSIRAEGDHVVTAMNLSLCEYGLAVAAKNDPIIGEYHLPGIGTYLATSDGPGSTNTCSANSAPSTGWTRADNSLLRTTNAP